MCHGSRKLPRDKLKGYILFEVCSRYISKVSKAERFTCSIVPIVLPDCVSDGWFLARFAWETVSGIYVLFEKPSK